MAKPRAGAPQEPITRLVKHVGSLANATGAVLVVGDAGMGKTHVLHQLAQEVQASGGRVGWSQCNRALGGPPLWEWRAAISELDADLSADFPGTDGLEVFQTIWRWLESAGSAQPTLLVLDDLHDASSATIDLFEQVSRRPRSAPWLVVAAARSSAAGTASEAVLRLSQMSVSRTVLKGIDAEQVRGIATSLDIDLAPARAEELIHFSGGNPLFIRRILETGADGFEVTPELLSFISDSIGELDTEIRPVAEALSVLGVTSARSTLRLMIDAEYWPASLVSGSTLVVDGHDVSFRHPLLREVIYEDLDDEQRSQLHARAAHAIEQLGGSASLAAVHWSRASLAGQGSMAAETALRAGHLALDMGMWADAVSHFSHAGAVLEQLHDLDDLAASGAYRARALSMGGDVQAALRAILDSVPAAEERADVSLANRQALCRELLRLRWREEPNPSVLDPVTITKTAQSLLGDEADPVSRSMLAGAAVIAGEIGGLASWHVAEAKEALAALGAETSPTVRGEAELTLRRALMAATDSSGERIQASKRAVTASRESGDVELTGRSLRMLLTDAMAAGDRPLALSTIAAFDTAATTALREHQALGQAGLAAIEGRYDDASDVLDGAAKELSYIGREAPSLDFARAIVALDQGGFNDIIAQYEPILAVVADASLRASFAYAAATEGHTDRASELIEGTIELLDAVAIDPLRPISLAMAAEAALIVGHSGATRLLELLEPLGGSCLTPANAAIPWLGSADRLIGLLLAAGGDLDGAERALRSSLAVHRGMQAAPWVARSLSGLALVHRAKGRASEAEVCEAEASVIAEQLGMSRIYGPDLGASPPDATAPGAGAPPGVSLRRAGRGWLLQPANEPGHLLPNLIGLGHLALLLEQPGNEWHVLDLVAGVGGVAPSGSHGGEMLDDLARRSYQRRMAVLRADLESADQDADIERSSQLLVEIDAIESELLTAFGLGGRGRRMDDEAERARVNVQRNLNRAITAVERVDPTLGDHLRHRVSTGRFCSYRPSVADPIVWLVQSSADGPPTL